MGVSEVHGAPRQVLLLQCGFPPYVQRLLLLASHHSSFPFSCYWLCLSGCFGFQHCRPLRCRQIDASELGVGGPALKVGMLDLRGWLRVVGTSRNWTQACYNCCKKIGSALSIPAKEVHAIYTLPSGGIPENSKPRDIRLPLVPSGQKGKVLNGT